MITLPIADWSSTANDGMVFGSVLQTLFGDVVFSARPADEVYAVIKDVSSGRSTHEDVSALANGTQTGGFRPFGTTAQMSAGDGLYLTCDKDCDEAFINVDIAGVGTWDGIQIFDSLDGKTASRELLIVEDQTNGLKVSGIGRIAWTSAIPSRRLFSPAPGDLPERRYIFMRPKNFVSVTTAPHVASVKIGLVSGGVAWHDATALANANLADGAFSTIPDTFPQVGVRLLVRVNEPTVGLDIRMYRRGPSSTTSVWEYLGAGGVPTALADVIDPSNGFRNGPATLSDSPQDFKVRWGLPSTWPSQTLSLPMADGSTKTMTGRFFQLRVTGVSPYGPVASALWRGRARQFGTANTLGFIARGPLTIRGLAIVSAEHVNTTEISGQIVNLNSGIGVSYIVPANSALPANISTNNLTLVSGDKLGVSCNSGSGLTGVFAELLID